MHYSSCRHSQGAVVPPGSLRSVTECLLELPFQRMGDWGFDVLTTITHWLKAALISQNFWAMLACRFWDSETTLTRKTELHRHGLEALWAYQGAHTELPCGV